MISNETTFKLVFRNIIFTLIFYLYYIYKKFFSQNNIKQLMIIHDKLLGFIIYKINVNNK